MNGEDRAAVKQILHAIEGGTLPPEKIQKRLMDIIQKESEKTNEPANEEIISACLDLMERLQGRLHEDEPKRIIALKQRIAEAIEEKAQNKKHRQKGFRAVTAIAAAVVLLLAGLSFSLRLTWIKGKSTPDGQQHVIMGHEITADAVAKAIAEHGASSQMFIEDFSRILELTQLNLFIPEKLGDKWVASSGHIDYLRGYIKISLRYENNDAPAESIVCSVCLYSDVENAYFSFEQSKEGKIIAIGDTEIYVSKNMERATACWYDQNTCFWLSGDITETEAAEMIYALIGGVKHQE